MSLSLKLFIASFGVILSGSTGFVYNAAQRIDTLEAYHVDDSARLERIENKLDRLIERPR